MAAAASAPTPTPLPLQGAFFPHSITGMIGGYQAGYNWQLANRVVLGVEADISFGSPVDVPRLAPASFNTTINYVAHRARPRRLRDGNVDALRDRRRRLGTYPCRPQ